MANKWVDMTPELTPEGIAVMKVGKLLIFDFEGSRTKFKVMRVTKEPKVWAMEVETYTGLEAQRIIDDLDHRYNRQQRRMIDKGQKK